MYNPQIPESGIFVWSNKIPQTKDQYCTTEIEKKANEKPEKRKLFVYNYIIIFIQIQHRKKYPCRINKIIDTNQFTQESRWDSPENQVSYIDDCSGYSTCKENCFPLWVADISRKEQKEKPELSNDVKVIGCIYNWPPFNKSPDKLRNACCSHKIEQNTGLLVELFVKEYSCDGRDKYTPDWYGIDYDLNGNTLYSMGRKYSIVLFPSLSLLSEGTTARGGYSFAAYAISRG